MKSALQALVVGTKVVVQQVCSQIHIQAADDAVHISAWVELEVLSLTCANVVNDVQTSSTVCECRGTV